MPFPDYEMDEFDGERLLRFSEAHVDQGPE